MSFSLEATITVPLAVTLLFVSAYKLPGVVTSLNNQSHIISEVVTKQNSADKFYHLEKIKHANSSYTACLTSPQKMQEMISWALDLNQLRQTKYE